MKNNTFFEKLQTIQNTMHKYSLLLFGYIAQI